MFSWAFFLTLCPRLFLPSIRLSLPPSRLSSPLAAFLSWRRRGRARYSTRLPSSSVRSPLTSTHQVRRLGHSSSFPGPWCPEQSTQNPNLDVLFLLTPTCENPMSYTDWVRPCFSLGSGDLCSYCLPICVICRVISEMAFLRKVGSLVKRSTGATSSLYQAVRCMSSSKLFIGGSEFSARHC